MQQYWINVRRSYNSAGLENRSYRCAMTSSCKHVPTYSIGCHYRAGHEEVALPPSVQIRLTPEWLYLPDHSYFTSPASFCVCFLLFIFFYPSFSPFSCLCFFFLLLLLLLISLLLFFNFRLLFDVSSLFILFPIYVFSASTLPVPSYSSSSL